jgi:hypothetical protein
MKHIILAIVILAIASPAIAQQHRRFETTAGGLNAYCMSGDPGDTKFCAGYITAWMEEMQVPFHTPNGDYVHRYFADGVTPEQIGRLLAKYLADHPEYENRAARVYLMGAALSGKILLVEPFTK